MKILKHHWFPVLLATIATIAGCAPSSHVLVGAARPPIQPSEVKIYSRPPANYPFSIRNTTCLLQRKLYSAQCSTE